MFPTFHNKNGIAAKQQILEYFGMEEKKKQLKRKTHFFSFKICFFLWYKKESKIQATKSTKPNS